MSRQFLPGAGFAEDLSDYARRSLERLRVEVMLGEPVTECSAAGVVYGGKILAAATKIWAAGVQASPAAEWLEAPADRAGRLKVEPDLTARRAQLQRKGALPLGRSDISRRLHPLFVGRAAAVDCPRTGQTECCSSRRTRSSSSLMIKPCPTTAE